MMMFNYTITPRNELFHDVSVVATITINRHNSLRNYLKIVYPQVLLWPVAFRSSGSTKTLLGTKLLHLTQKTWNLDTAPLQIHTYTEHHYNIKQIL